MTHEALMLSLNTAQVDQLMGYCVVNRVHAWREIAPTAERNQALRAEQRTEPLRFAVTEEERLVLWQMFGALMQLSSVQTSVVDRASVFGGLASWLQMLRTARQTQALGSQRGGQSHG